MINFDPSNVRPHGKGGPKSFRELTKFADCWQIANGGGQFFFMDPDFLHKKRTDFEVLSVQSKGHNYYLWPSACLTHFDSTKEDKPHTPSSPHQLYILAFSITSDMIKELKKQTTIPEVIYKVSKRITYRALQVA